MEMQALKLKLPLMVRLVLLHKVAIQEIYYNTLITKGKKERK